MRFATTSIAPGRSTRRTARASRRWRSAQTGRRSSGSPAGGSSPGWPRWTPPATQITCTGCWPRSRSPREEAAMTLPPMPPIHSGAAGPPPDRSSVDGDGSLSSPLGRAAVTMVGYLVLLWVLDLVNNVRHRSLNSDLGIEPRQPDRLPEIFTAPFLHGSVAPLPANAMPLFGLGLIAALTGVWRFVGVTAVIVVVSG